MTMSNAAESNNAEEDLRPNLAFLLSGTVAVALISALSLL